MYSSLFLCALPLVLLRLWWRGRRAPAYRQRWQERLGIYAQTPVSGVIWFHAVSVGEAEAVFPLIRRLQQRYPAQPILVTTTTPTGSARVKTVLGTSVSHVYLPYDIPFALQRFLNAFQPKLTIFLEKELWPNLFAACRNRRLPVLVINARLSDRSSKGYLRIRNLVQATLACVDRIACQTESDLHNFVRIGASADQVEVFGNIKFDLDIDPQLIEAGRRLKRNEFSGRWVWICASTHEGEEEQLIAVYKQLKLQIPELLCVLVPRHPERFDRVAALCVQQGLLVARRSVEQPVLPDTDVYLADTMGELKMLYASSDAAFVGGSWATVGGHNVLEPAALSTPVLFGHHMFNFQEIADQMLSAGAAEQCDDGDALYAALLRIYQQPELREQRQASAAHFVHRNQGATERVMNLLGQYLSG